ncbi:MAG: ABC transporter ATP-binding protein, partial [Chloroflexi bacterium]|nr:ABC transporter ATP-binding protein [Chloroflexota bacterium]
MKVLWRLLQFVRPYWWGSSITVVLILILTFFRLGPAWFTKLIIDQAIPEHDFWLAMLFVGAMIGVAGLTNALTAAEMYLEQWVGQRVIYDLRAVLYDHLQSQSMSFYDVNQTGQLMSRVTNDVNQVQFFLTQGLARLVHTAVTIAIFLGVMFFLDPVLTAVSLLVTPLVVYFQKQFAAVMPMYRRAMQRSADLNVVIQENVTGIKLVKAFNREPFEATRFNDVNWDIRESRMKANMAMAVASPGIDFATYVSAIIIIVFGGWRVMEGVLTIGSLAAFYSYVLTMWAPVRWVSFINQMAQQAVASGERVFEILDTPLDVAETPDAIVLPRLQGRVEFENVSFAYGKNPPLLRDINLTIEPGNTAALVGPSGSGKTTLINLIPRFYDVTAGKVLIDGHDVRDVALEGLRSQIGMVMQETFLFNMPIHENISYGKSDATQEQIEAAARAAHAHEFIRELPEGYDTLVGERGARLSGGQRQRIAIARAILVDPRILILDEATSSVDNRTDFLIRQALDRLMEGRTSIVIAHRLSTVRRAHQILVMEEGCITAQGTHEELLHTSPLYQHLYEIQFALQAEGSPSSPDPFSHAEEKGRAVPLSLDGRGARGEG